MKMSVTVIAIVTLSLSSALILKKHHKKFQLFTILIIAVFIPGGKTVSPHVAPFPGLLVHFTRPESIQLLYSKIIIFSVLVEGLSRQSVPFFRILCLCLSVPLFPCLYPCISLPLFFSAWWDHSSENQRFQRTVFYTILQYFHSKYDHNNYK